MSFLAIYLTASLVVILLISSLYAIINKNAPKSFKTEEIAGAAGAGQSVGMLQNGYACALMLGLSLVLVSPDLLSNSFNQSDANLGTFSITMTYILLICTMHIILTVKPSALNESALLLGFSTLGLILMCQTSHFIGLYLGVELYSLSAYILASGAEGVYSSSKHDVQSGLTNYKSYIVNKPSIGAGLKYFLLSALSSGVLVAGIGIVYASTGELTINGLARAFSMMAGYGIAESGEISDPKFAMLGMGLIISTLIFKIGAAPFHFWVPDVYSKVSLFVNFYLISVPKIGILITLIKISFIFKISSFLSLLILISSMLSLAVGALGGLVQLKTTRLLAYSSISHTGYILLALYAALIPEHTNFVTDSGPLNETIYSTISTPSPMHIYSICLYLIVYSFMTVNMFTILYCIKIHSHNFDNLKFFKKEVKNSSNLLDQKSSNVTGTYTVMADDLICPRLPNISGLKGTSSLNPFLACSMAVTLLSMAGVPPLAGFVAKLSVYMVVLDSGALIPAIFAVLSSVISAVYYLRAIKVSYFYTPDKTNNVLSTLNALPEALESSSNNISAFDKGFLKDKKNNYITPFSSIVISLCTLLIIFFPILKPSFLFLYLNNI